MTKNQMRAVVAEALCQVAERFNNHPDAVFTGAEIVEILSKASIEMSMKVLAEQPQAAKVSTYRVCDGVSTLVYSENACGSD